MLLLYFTEQPMSTYPEDEGLKVAGHTVLTFSNKFFDPVEGSRLYNERLEECLYVEEMGYDGVMLNEHHNAPFSMHANINIHAAILAGMTKKLKLVLLGNPLPIIYNPVRIAEELAMIDMISKGRLVSGFIRGGGTEQLATNVNPAFNRERFQEAHDLIIKTWTEPGPFRWEGDQYQFRVVNPWAVPLQKPHPRIWIPGVTSAETIQWAAEHRYPYMGLNTTIPEINRIKQIYGEAAAKAGYTPRPENLGYFIRCHVADTEEKAFKNAREFMWMQGEFTGVGHPVWANPSGYASPATRRARLPAIAKGERKEWPPFEQQLEDRTIIAGTPDQVVRTIRPILEQTRPGTVILWGNDGKVSHEDSMDCIRLTGQEVLPALREIGKELELDSPFDVDSPVSLAFTPKEELKPTAA